MQRVTRDAPRATGTDARAQPSGAGVFRADVEGMRAVAITLVVLYHAGLAPITGGYVGVDVFFVISGFVITMTLGRELARRGTISIPGFYARRVTRLLPAATAVIVATLVASWLWMPPIVVGDIALDAVACTLYAINYRLAIVGVDYFAADAPSPLQHYWSLAVEEQFYLVWPVLLLAITVLLARRARAGDKGRTIPPVRAAAVLLVVIVVSFAACVWLTGRSLPWAYFAGPTRAWELGLGALVAVTAGALARVPARAAAVSTWVGLGAVVASALWYDDATAFPGSAALLPVLGTALVLAGGCAAPRAGAEMVLRGSAFQWVGRLSYSWYLWHWPVLVFAPVILGFEPGLGIRLVGAAGSLAIAAACYTFLEDPVRRAARWRARPWRAIALGVSLSAGAAAFAVLVSATVPEPVGTGTAADLPAAMGRYASPTPTGAAAGPVLAGSDGSAAAAERELTAAITAALSRTAAPANLTPSLRAAGGDVPPIYADGCDPPMTDVTVSSPCMYGVPNSATTIVLYGDSHAAQWFPAVNLVALRHGWRLHVITKSSCSPAYVVTYNWRLKRPYSECDAWRTASLARIRQLGPALVVMSSRIGSPPATDGDPDRTWVDGWRRAVQPVVADGIRVVLIHDTPQPKTDVPRCVSTHLRDVRRCATPTREAVLYPPLRRMVAEAVAAEHVTVVDPTPWFCALGMCPSIVGNVLVYKDATHISTTYAALLAPVLDPALAG